MTLFTVSVAFVLIVSAYCSLSEAALYSIRLPFVRQLADSGSQAGAVLAGFKANMERPITAILIVNTVANTAGASVAGAQARALWGDTALIWFSAAFTLSVLLLSEILPKVAGVNYRRVVAPAISVPWALAIKFLYPLVWLSQKVSRVFSKADGPLAPEEEVHQLAMMSAEEGSILPLEAKLVQNVLRLNEVLARDIMTPRTVVFKLEAAKTVAEITDEVGRQPHSRIPIHATGDPEDWIGLVMKEDVLTAMARDQFDVSLEALKKPLGFVPEVVPGHKLLNEFLERRAHLLAVVDEYGGMLGVVTLEDVMESLLGTEIVDETDQVVDLRQVARRRGARKLGAAMRPPGDPSP
ncbi:MAG: hemolysin family protein [Thermoanaerobaculia bacterium]